MHAFLLSLVLGVAHAGDPAAATTTPAALMEPSKATAKAPDTYKVKFETTEGDFVVEVQRAWAPQGADRFYNLVKLGFFDDTAFFRNISGFMVQFGLNGDPQVNGVWRKAKIMDDPVTQANKRGTITFATSGKDSRTTQVFINFSDGNTRLDDMGFSPFGKVVEGMKVVDALYNGYGEGAPRGRGPDQQRIQEEGNTYLKANFPELDFIKKATIAQ